MFHRYRCPRNESIILRRRPQDFRRGGTGGWDPVSSSVGGSGSSAQTVPSGTEAGEHSGFDATAAPAEAVLRLLGARGAPAGADPDLPRARPGERIERGRTGRSTTSRARAPRSRRPSRPPPSPKVRAAVATTGNARATGALPCSRSPPLRVSPLRPRRLSWRPRLTGEAEAPRRDDGPRARREGTWSGRTTSAPKGGPARATIVYFGGLALVSPRSMAAGRPGAHSRRRRIDNRQMLRPIRARSDQCPVRSGRGAGEQRGVLRSLVERARGATERAHGTKRNADLGADATPQSICTASPASSGGVGLADGERLTPLPTRSPPAPRSSSPPRSEGSRGSRYHGAAVERAARRTRATFPPLRHWPSGRGGDER